MIKSSSLFKFNNEMKTAIGMVMRYEIEGVYGYRIERVCISGLVDSALSSGLRRLLPHLRQRVSRGLAIYGRGSGSLAVHNTDSIGPTANVL